MDWVTPRGCGAEKNMKKMPTTSLPTAASDTATSDTAAPIIVAPDASGTHVAETHTFGASVPTSAKSGSAGTHVFGSGTPASDTPVAGVVTPNVAAPNADGKAWWRSLFSRFVPDPTERDVDKTSVRLVWFSATGVLLLFLWAAVAEIDQTARGLGQVVPSQRVQLVQNLEGGIVQEITVREGQQVEKNAIVMRIDNESADSQYREALVRSLEHEASIARFEALITGAEPQYPPSVMENPDLIHRQNALLHAAREQNTAELHVLALQVESIKRALAEQKEAQKQRRTSLALTEKERSLALPALKARAYAELDFLNIEQRLQALKADLAVFEHSIPRMETAAQEAQERLRLRKAEIQSEYRQRLNEVQVQFLSLRELITAADDKVKRTVMRSPVKGIVKAIYVNTVGGVVAPGVTVMEVVPMDDSFIIEARFSPADIAFLYPGQKALVRITAYDFSVYGGVEGKVENISADTLQNKQGDTYYQVKVRTNSTHMRHGGENLPILVGMMAEVDILTGKKTILDYLLKPLLKAQQRALRER